MNGVPFLNVEYMYLRITDFFNNFDPVSFGASVEHYAGYIKPLGWLVTIFFLSLMVYTFIKTKKIENAVYAEMFRKPDQAEVPIASAQDAALNERWMKVQAHISSTNPSDWKIAILEADIMLADILEKKGYQGDSISDKLKGVDKKDFITLDSAWAAHKIRNQIAHEGTGFQLNEREARQAIELYKTVFSEFYHI
jgi:hypothetical protein